MTATRPTGIPTLWGIGAACAAVAAVTAVASLIGAGDLVTVPGTHRLVIGAAVAGLIVSAMIGLAWRLHATRSRRADTAIVRAGLCLTAAGFYATPFVATRIAEQSTVLRVLDVHASTVFALITLSAATIGALCVFAAAVVIRREAESADGGRPIRLGRSGMTAAAVTLVVSTVATGGTVVPAQHAADISPRLAPVTGPAAVPQTMNTVAFRLRFADGSDGVLAGGSGFFTVSAATITAYDGRNSDRRWQFVTAPIGGLDTAFRPEIVGSGDDRVLVVTGRTVTVGIDPITGDVRWRSASSEHRRIRSSWRVNVDREPGSQRPSQVTVMNPTTGALDRRIDLPCAPWVAVDAQYWLRTDCAAPDTVVITSFETGREQRVTTAPTTRWEYLAPRIVAPGVFAVQFNGGQRDQRGKPQFTAVVDAKSGTVVDQFESPFSDPSPMNDGLLGFIDSGFYARPAFGDTPAVMIRNVAEHRWIRIPGDVHSPTPSGFFWLGRDLVLATSTRTLQIIDPTDRTMTSRPGPCTPREPHNEAQLHSLTPAHGSVVALCTWKGYPSSSSEIVGLR